MRRPLRPFLVIGIGSPSRGDDALGPLLVEGIEAMDLPGVERLTDFELQVEHALDLPGREEVVLVDATVTGESPCSLAGAGRGRPDARARIAPHAGTSRRRVGNPSVRRGTGAGDGNCRATPFSR
ncbi:MAG: hypothetical protein BroJett026_15920 [Betaproteobacteria bacterium]|nr:MAG: hypothetical protein BroJett026_15920 [Betaproteobacteria bacterium]